MKLCIIATRLFSGGFTSSMLNMIHALQKSGHEVDVMFIDASHHELPISLLKGVKVIPCTRVAHHRTTPALILHFKTEKHQIQTIQKQILKETDGDKKRILTQRLLQVSILQDTIDNYETYDLRSYDAVLSWEELNANDFLAFRVKAKKKIGWIHPDYIGAGFDAVSDRNVFEALDWVVLVCNASRNSFLKAFPDMKDKTAVIYNVLDTEKIDQFSQEKPMFQKSSMDLVSVCRLDIVVKGLDRMLDAAAALDQSHIAYEWYVIGDGEGRKELEQQIVSRGLSHLHLLGQLDNPYACMKQADLLVLLSRREGYPMVVSEAMYLNTPCFVTPYLSASEQIQNGKDGFITTMEQSQINHDLTELLVHPETVKAAAAVLQKEDKSRYAALHGLEQVLDA